MTPCSGFKDLGVFAVVILLAGLVYVVKKWPNGIDKTFSQHVAKSREGIIFYRILFGVSLPILLMFFFGWFIPEFDLSFWFGLLVALSAVLQIICTLVPETGGRKTTIHRTSAFLSADMLLPALYILCINNDLSSFSRAISILCFVVMASIVLILVPKNGYHKYVLIFQALYFSAFFGAILTATYF